VNKPDFVKALFLVIKFHYKHFSEEKKPEKETNDDSILTDEQFWTQDESESNKTITEVISKHSDDTAKNVDFVEKKSDNSNHLSTLQIIKETDDVKVVEKVCTFYRQTKCSSGGSGAKCNKGSHPPKCIVFLKFGLKKFAERGCDGKCGRFHPRLCYSSLRSQTCNKSDCRLPHIKGTVKKQGNWVHSSSRPAATSNVSTTTPNAIPGMQLTEKSCSQTSQNVATPTMDHFLGMLQSLQRGQDQQAKLIDFLIRKQANPMPQTQHLNQSTWANSPRMYP
jgi:hypothetical protein